MEKLNDDGEIQAERDVPKNRLGKHNPKHSPKHSTAQEDKQREWENAKIYNVEDTLA